MADLPPDEIFAGDISCETSGRPPKTKIGKIIQEFNVIALKEHYDKLREREHRLIQSTNEYLAQFRRAKRGLEDLPEDAPQPQMTLLRQRQNVRRPLSREQLRKLTPAMREKLFTIPVQYIPANARSIPPEEFRRESPSIPSQFNEMSPTAGGATESALSSPLHVPPEPFSPIQSSPVPTSPLPSSPIPSVMVTPPSPTSLSLPGFEDFEIHEQQIPHDSPLFPETSIRSDSGVNNYICVGDSLNIQTQAESPASYSQVTRVDSSIPPAGPSRMIDSPLNITYTAELTPKQFKTPFISNTRFGYTDPTAKRLNLPPGPYEIATPYRQTFVLTSPEREEPLLLNIDVDPKPLTETESGEHFICDISLELEPERQGRRRRQQLSPTITYGIPPAVTPTSTRRHGLFTPRGIFQKKHFNLRRLNEYDISDLPWSPQDLPQEYRSPVSPFPPSPYYSDRSISWERGPDSSYGSPVSGGDSDRMSPLIKGMYDESTPESSSPTYYRGRLPGFSGTPESDLSPMIKGPYYKSKSPTHSRTPSPIIKGAIHRGYTTQSPVSDRMSDRSSSPIVKRQIYQDSDSPFTMSPGSDRIHDRSPSPVIKSRTITYDAPPAITPTSTRRHGLFTPRGIFKKRHLNLRRLDEHDISDLPWSPQDLPQEYRSPLSPFPPSPYHSDRSISWERGPDSTYGSPVMITGSDRMSPIIKGMYDESTPESSSPTYYRGRSPRISGTPESDLSPMIKEPYCKIMSPTLSRPASSLPDRALDRSPSPIIKRRIYQDSDSPFSMSPASARSFDSSPSSAKQVTFDTSASPMALNELYTSLSPGYKADIDTSGSPQVDGDSFWSPPQAVQTIQASGLSTNYEYRDDALNRRVLLDQSLPPRADQAFYSSASSPEYGYSDDPLNRRVLLDQSLPPDADQTFYSSASSPKYGYSDDPLNRRVQLDSSTPPHGYSDDPLNRRWRPDEMRQQGGLFDHSAASQISQSSGRSALSPESRYQEDPMNRRNLSELLQQARAGFNRSPSPQRNQTMNETNGASFDSDGGYLEESFGGILSFPQ